MSSIKEKAPTGGAATAGGIWYQSLWIVLQAATGRLASHSGEADIGLRLVLEPDGGDVRIERVDRRRVVQLKVRSGGTWSLKQVVEDVLPDLYKAVDLDDQEVAYEFVTEGRGDGWKQARSFFAGLGGRLAGGDFDAAYAALSTTRHVRFRRGKGDFGGTGDATEKGLFDCIAEQLRGPRPERGKPDEREPIEVVRRKTWHLLSRFQFAGGHTPAGVRAEVERALMEVAPRREDVPNLCQAMAGWITERSSANGTVITPKEVFEAQKLGDVVPASHLLTLRRRCREAITDRLDGLKYRADHDVRRDDAAATDTAVVAVTGDSGDGKSWGVYAAADLAETPAVVLLDESSGDAQEDLQRAADAVWRAALGHDGKLPLRNVADRLADALGPACGTPWLTLCIDRVNSVDVVNRLLLEPLEQWGVRLVLGCEPAAGKVVEQRVEGNDGAVRVRTLGRFSSSELHRYLDLRLGGDAHTTVPQDVRDVLRKPQMAGIYCDLVAASGANASGWRPRDEYELVDRYWSRLGPPENAGHPRDELRLRRLAASALDGRAYPWSVDQLDEAELDDAAISRLVRLGWLRETGSAGDYEVPHDRLLGYAAARALVRRCRDDKIDAPAAVEALKAAAEGPHARRLGYLLMDWFHLAIGDPNVSPTVPDVLRLHGDDGDHRHREALHRHLLPTLGRRAVPLLLGRLKEVAVASIDYEVGPLVAGLADALADSQEEVTHAVLELLMDNDERVRRAGLRLMARRPSVEALDVAWRLHREVQTAEPDQNVHGAAMQRHLRYEESLDALRAGTHLSPAWLDRAIREAEPLANPVHDLAWLTASLNDGGGVWRARKTELFEKVRPDKRRSLAANIGAWRDADEAHHLEIWAAAGDAAGEGFLASRAVAEMARIDPKRAVGLLPMVAPLELGMSRGWMLPRLFLLAGDATRNAMHNIIAGLGDPLGGATLYRDNANEMDVRTLDLLLDKLDERLRMVLDRVRSGGQAQLNGDCVVDALMALAEVGRPNLLNALARRGGSQLEERLADFLIQGVGPRPGVGTDSLARDPAVRLLLKLGGDGHGRVARSYLAADSQYARLDGVDMAKLLADGGTLAAVRDAATATEAWSGDWPLVQQEAARVLAAHADAVGLWEAAQRLGIDIALATDELPDEAELSDELAQELTRLVAERDPERLREAMVFLGLFRHGPVIQEALAILQESDDRATRAVAILTLRMMAPQDSVVVEALRPHLIGDLRPNTVEALGRIGTAAALQALLDSLNEHWDERLAAWLAGQPATVDRATDLIVERLHDHGSKPIEAGAFSSLHELTSLGGPLGELLATASDAVVARVVPRVGGLLQERLRESALQPEGGLHFVGSKRNAIRGLASFDPAAAFSAAAAALSDSDARDRPLYPPLLYRISPTAARERFLRVAAHERDEAVLWSMAYALDPEADAAWLRDTLEAPDTPTRLAVCRLAAGPCGSEIEEELRRVLNDPTNMVAKAAEHSLRHVEAQRRASALVAAISSDAAQARAAASVEAATAVGDVGFEQCAAPGWIDDLMKCEASRRFPTLGQAAAGHINRARKTAADKAKSEASRRRLEA